MAGQQHEHPRSRLAGLEQPFTVLVMAWLAEPSHAPHLVRGQYGEGLLMARKHRCNGSPPLQIVVHRGIYAHPSLTSSEKPHLSRAPKRQRHSLRSFRLSSYGEAASPLEDADVRSPRARACAFRRLRFARNASFNRVCFESLPESLFADAPAGLSRLWFSSVIVGSSNEFVEGCHISRRSSRWTKNLTRTSLPAKWSNSRS